MTHPLLSIINAHKQGRPIGLPSVCSANPFVLEAAVRHAQTTGQCLCIESTSQQVNPDGGYARQTPLAFARDLRRSAEKIGLPEHQIILGGDHLGPAPWRHETADEAMAKARELVRQCVFAGYEKLHLDPTTPCRDDVQDGAPGLSLKMIAQRTAALCETAEAAAKERGMPENRLCYIVGAEVPTPGGVSGKPAEIRVSAAAGVGEMIDMMGRAFRDKGLTSAWGRCIAVVVETGAGFGPDVIYDYDPSKTRALKAFIETEKNMVYEAHSTDFQLESALADMVRDHFAILKVGPALTFAVREGLFALAHIEGEWLGKKKGIARSRLPDILEAVMNADGTHWRAHYAGEPEALGRIFLYGFSDRIRYYWSDPRCIAAIDRLFQNLTGNAIPLPLLSQFLPEQFHAVREGRCAGAPADLVRDKIFRVLEGYSRACGARFDENTPEK